MGIRLGRTRFPKLKPQINPDGRRFHFTARNAQSAEAFTANDTNHAKELSTTRLRRATARQADDPDGHGYADTPRFRCGKSLVASFKEW